MPRAVPLPIAPVVPDSALLSTILRELLALRADVAALRSANDRGTKTDDTALSAPLLHAIATASGGLTFTVAELLLHAEVVASHAADQRLHDAIVGAVGSINGRRLGKLLGRLEGCELDGLCIVRVGADRNGIAWRVASLRV